MSQLIKQMATYNDKPGFEDNHEPNDEAAQDSDVSKEEKSIGVTRKRKAEIAIFKKAKKKAEIVAADEMSKNIFGFHEMQTSCTNCDELKAQVKEKNLLIKKIEDELKEKNLL